MFRDRGGEARGGAEGVGACEGGGAGGAFAGCGREGRFGGVVACVWDVGPAGGGDGGGGGEDFDCWHLASSGGEGGGDLLP